MEKIIIFIVIMVLTSIFSKGKKKKNWRGNLSNVITPKQSNKFMEKNFDEDFDETELSHELEKNEVSKISKYESSSNEDMINGITDTSSIIENSNGKNEKIMEDKVIDNPEVVTTETNKTNKMYITLKMSESKARLLKNIKSN